MKVWNITTGGDTIIASGTTVEKMRAQFYNASTNDVNVTIWVTDATGGASGAKIIKELDLTEGSHEAYHIAGLESGDTVKASVTASTGNPNVNIVTWN